MSLFEIVGRNPLFGEIKVQGAKNSILPILAASVLVDGQTIIKNCPNISDVYSAIKILRYLGCDVLFEDNTVVIDSVNAHRSEISNDLMCEMRSSIFFLGSIISRFHRAKMSSPGGCELGPRPVDLHILALKKLGCTVDERHGFIDCTVKDRLFGAEINLAFPSVGATENIILAAVKAKGRTIITNPAREPEIIDLANFLNQCGAKVYGAGDSKIVIDGVARLHGIEYDVCPDRIVAATYMSAVSMTGGDLHLIGNLQDSLVGVSSIFEYMGCAVTKYNDSVQIKSNGRLKSAGIIKTQPFPGFPTDAQAPLMAATTLCDGVSVFVENIFESRYKHVPELIKMGANIAVEGKVAVVSGVRELYFSNVAAYDLRGGAALVCAALAAEGTTTISNIHHIERGYEAIEQVLSSVGGKIIRI